MYPHQAERLGEALASQGLAALVATTPQNIHYVTGYRSPAPAISRSSDLYGVFTPNGTGLVVPAIEMAAIAADGTDVDHVVCHGRLVIECAGGTDRGADRLREWLARSAASGPDALAAALRALGVGAGTVGLDEGGLGPAGWRRLVERLDGITVVPAADHLARARAVKGPWEIECLRRAVHIAEEAMNAVIQMLRPGVTEREAASLFEAEIAKRGALPARAVIAMGERAALPTAPSSDRALRPGDLVRLDVGCLYKGYWSDVARTAVMGEPSERQQALYDAIQAGEEAAIAAVKAGVTAEHVFDLALARTREAGLPRFERPHAGGGIGLEPREWPALGPGERAALEPGMVLVIETPYFEYGWGGLHVKDTVLVTSVGSQILNRSNRGLVVLD
ncbi:MAG: aminopeptidase P family protein [Candidatus Rokubacteria bacterium]|nr:aminopeptidase P family protein [Candidatus Rokubacteria bacterium]